MTQKIHENKGQLTPTGRVPNWDDDAYAWKYSNAAHLVSHRYYGTVYRTLCGRDMPVNDPSRKRYAAEPYQVLAEPTKSETTIGWEEGGIHHCRGCEIVLRRMKHRAMKASAEFTEENWRAYYEDAGGTYHD